MQSYQKKFLIIGCLGLFTAIFYQCKSNFSYKESNVQTILVDSKLDENLKTNLLIAPKKKELDAIMNRVLTISEEELVKDKDQNLANLSADLVLFAAQEYAKTNNQSLPEICILNSGGLRNTLPKGEIKVKNMFELMPFENEIVIGKILGKDLRGFADLVVKEKKLHPVSNIKLTIKGSTIRTFLIDGKPVEEARIYSFATSDYLYNGGDRMDFFQKAQSVVFTGIKIRDAMIEQIAKMPVIKNYKERRLEIEE